MPPFPSFTVAVPSPSNFDGPPSAAGVLAPLVPDELTDANVLTLIVPTAMLDKLPRDGSGNLAVQFSGWASFDVVNDPPNPCNYFRFRLIQPNWVSGDFVDNVVGGPADVAFRSALRHFTPGIFGAEFIQWMSSFQLPADAPSTFCNPGLFNLSYTFFGADSGGNLPPETPFTPPP